MIPNKQTNKSMTLLKVLDTLLSTITRSMVILLSTVTAFTVFGGTLVTGLNVFLLMGAILGGSLLFDLVAGGLRYFSNIMIQREVNRLMDEIKNVAITDSVRGTQTLPSLPSDNGSLN